MGGRSPGASRSPGDHRNHAWVTPHASQRPGCLANFEILADGCYGQEKLRSKRGHRAQRPCHLAHSSGVREKLLGLSQVDLRLVAVALKHV